MKKTPILFAVTSCLSTGLFLLSSCHKGDLPVFDPRNGNADFKQCVITKLEGKGGGVEFPFDMHRTITYNSRRDPVAVEPDFIGTGSPRLKFYYDNKGRLISLGGEYLNGGFESWHNYIYDKAGRITGDSVYIFGTVGDPGSALIKRYSELIYDDLNRVIMEVRDPHQSGPYQDTTRYFYDARGNLFGNIKPYDNEINPLLSNKIWRFLARNYSVNNAGSPTAYNDHGLPLRLEGNALDSWYYDIWGVSGDVVTIEYDCNCAPQKGL